MGPAGGRAGLADPAVSAGEGSADRALGGASTASRGMGPAGGGGVFGPRQGRGSQWARPGRYRAWARVEQGTSRMVQAATGRMVLKKMTSSDRIPQVLVVDDEPNIRELVQV